MKSPSSYLGLLVQLLRLGICVYLIYTAAFDYTNGQASKNWPAVKGKLTIAETKTVKVKGETKLEANIQYNYTVNGRTYTADRVVFGGLMTRDPAKVIDELKSAKELNVYYNPDKPEDSCIEKGFNLTVIVCESLAALLMAVLAVIEQRKIRKENETNQSLKSNLEGERLSSLAGLKQQKESSLSNADSKTNSNKIKTKTAISVLVLVALAAAGLTMLENIELPGIPTKLVAVGVLVGGGLLLVILVSLIAPCVALLARRRSFALAEALASFNAAIFSGFSTSNELAMARGLQAEVAQERLQYDKALSFSKQALDVMAQRRILVADVSVANLSEKEKQLVDTVDKQGSDLESLCNQSLGSIYFDMGNYDEALKHANEAITLAEDSLKNSSKDNPGTQLALAWALYLRGRVENVLGSLDDAKADLKRAMAIRQTVKLPHPEELAITMANLASTYTMQKDYRAAERLIDEALKMLEGSTEKAMQVARATVQFHRAEMKIHSGDYDNAEAVLNECIALREKLLQPNHPHIAEAYLVAAKLSQQKGRSTEASVQREKAVAILKFCFGDKHPLISNGGTIKTTSNTVSRTNYAKY